MLYWTHAALNSGLQNEYYTSQLTQGIDLVGVRCGQNEYYTSQLTQGSDLVGVRCGQLEHLSTVYRAPSCALTPAEVDLCVAIHDNMQDMFFLALE